MGATCPEVRGIQKVPLPSRRPGLVKTVCESDFEVACLFQVGCPYGVNSSKVCESSSVDEMLPVRFGMDIGIQPKAASSQCDVVSLAGGTEYKLAPRQLSDNLRTGVHIVHWHLGREQPFAIFEVRCFCAIAL